MPRLHLVRARLDDVLYDTHVMDPGPEYDFLRD